MSPEAPQSGEERRQDGLPFPEEIDRNLREWLRSVEDASKGLRRVLLDYRRIARGGGGPDPFKLGEWLRNRAETLGMAGRLAEMGRELEAKLDELAQHALLRLDSNLREAIREKGWRMDGQWPKYYVERVVRLEIDEKERVVNVGETSVRTLHLPTVITALEEQVRDLVPDNFDAGRFLEALASAYDRLSAPGQGGVAIWQLYREVVVAHQSRGFWRDACSRLFHPLGEQRFRAWLTALLERESTETGDGRQLRLLPPIKADEGMYLYQPGEHRFAFVGRVEFLPARMEGTP